MSPGASPGLPSKMVIACVSTSVTLLLVWRLLPRSQPHDTVALVHVADDLSRQFELRDAGLGSGKARRAEPRLQRLPIDEQQAAMFFPLSKGDMYDPHTFSRRKSNVKVNRPFPEHPDGKWVIRTNSFGMREDQDPSRTRPDLRILVAGDSHVDGVCANADSFANQLEALLIDAHPGRTIEVLNLSHGGWSFYNYLGALEAYLELEPDLFIVTVYGGNDFGSLPLHHYHRGEELHLTAPRLQRRLGKLARVQSGRAQFWNQAAYFASNPGEEASAEEMAQEVTAEMQAVAREHDVGLIAVYLPPLRDVQREAYLDLVSIGERMVQLDPTALAVSDRLADSWTAWCAASDVPCLDLRSVFRAASTPLYWQTDQHINVAGHELIAGELLALVEGQALLE